ncbi:hypothetical protein IFR05_006220 [Cadophora sp. M221]|nr:hypothetical protein IFR05_006220 [Cadophora sp. M221]
MFDVEDVMGQLSADEKTALLSGSDFWHTVALPKHNVPSIRCADGPNGIRGTRFFAGVPAACLPCGTALGATWDKDLLYQAGVLLGKESIAKGARCWLGPTINIQRSPLGGRGFESYSEDPHLSGILASHIIQGCQSTGVISVVKHFVCNDQEDERRAVNTIVTERALREIYCRPFQIAARDSNPGGLMTSYNKVNGQHCSQDPKLLDTMVRKEWGWDPLIMSDWYGTYSTEGALNAGLDLEMPGKSRYRGTLLDFALASRLVTQAVMDQRVRRVLSFVKQVSTVEVSLTEGVRDTPEDRALNRQLCANSIVLLKNDDNILPLNVITGDRIGLIGSHIKLSAPSGGGSASLEPYYTVSLFDAIKSKFPASVHIEHEVGANAHKMLPILSQGMQGPDTASPRGVIKFYNKPWTPEGSPRECICEEPLSQFYFQLMDYNRNPKLNYNLFYATAETSFAPDVDGTWEFGLTVCGTANLYIDDVLLIENTTAQESGEAFFKKGTVEKIGRIVMESNKTYSIRVEFGSALTSKLMSVGVVSFGGGGVRLGASPVASADENIAKAVQLAKRCQHVVLCTGLNGEWESEGFDRTHMDLPPGVDKLITEVLAANPNTIIVNQSGTPVTMPWISSAKSVLQAWYGGNELGNGISDVLFGSVNPSGRLPLTWPKRVQDNPSFGNFGSVRGRVLYGEDIFVGYRHYDLMEKDPLFCFGHGLSYTDFTLTEPIFSASSVSLTVSNTGSRPGAAIIQIYVCAKGSKTNRPVKELHGFGKVNLAKNESKIAEIGIDRYAGSFWDEIEHQWVAEAGEYEIQVGMSSRDIRLTGSFVIEKTRTWRGL